MIEFTARVPLGQDGIAERQEGNGLSVVDDRYGRIKGTCRCPAMTKAFSPESEPAEIRQRD